MVVCRCVEKNFDLCRYSRVLAPKNFLSTPEEVFGEGKLFDKEVEEKTRLKMEEERRKREEEEGHYEVGRITEVKFKKDGAREFLIRWKGHGPEVDSWEPEENLDCPDKIRTFMEKHERILNVNEKELRVARKKVERLAYGNFKGSSRNRKGFRKTYEDMDASDDDF